MAVWVYVLVRCSPTSGIIERFEEKAVKAGEMTRVPLLDSQEMIDQQQMPFLVRRMGSGHYVDRLS